MSSIKKLAPTIPLRRSSSNNSNNSNNNSINNSPIDNSELKQLSLDDDEDDNNTNDEFKISDVPQQSNLPPINLKTQTTRESMVVSKQIIGSYVMGELIGKGGFASVFKGLNTINGDFVAIKRFNKSKISKEQLASVSTELELLQKLNHESIARVLGKDENDDYIFLFLEFMENGSLSSILNQYGTFPEPLLANYMESVLKGLVYLHSENVIHRDIKAANILINKAGDAKLSDFGVAGEIQESDKRYSVVGTPYWMSPEVIEMSGSSPASDIWSIGCTTVELLTGSPPYFHLNPMSAMFRIVQDDKPQFPKNISKELYDFLDRCFVKSCEDRATAKELLGHTWISKNKIIINQQKQNSLSFRSTTNALDQISKTISVFNQELQQKEISRSSSDQGSDPEDSLSESNSSSHDDTNFNKNSPILSPNQISKHQHNNNNIQINQQNEIEIRKLNLDNHSLKCKIKELESEMKRQSEKLDESERKYKEILLSSMHYIYIVDSTINLTNNSTVKPNISNEVTHLRNIMRDQIESEYYNAYPDDNMVPRFIQRRLTRDTLIHIPKKALEAQKRREKEEKKKQEKKKQEKEREEKKEKERSDKEKLDKEKRSQSFNNFTTGSIGGSLKDNNSTISSFSPLKSNSSSFIGTRRTNSKNSITSEISAQILQNVKLIPPVNSQIKDLNKDLNNNNNNNSTPSSPNRK